MKKFIFWSREWFSESSMPESFLVKDVLSILSCGLDISNIYWNGWRRRNWGLLERWRGVERKKLKAKHYSFIKPQL